MYDTSHMTGRVETHPSPPAPATTPKYNPPQGDRLLHLFHDLQTGYTALPILHGNVISLMLHCTHTV